MCVCVCVCVCVRACVRACVCVFVHVNAEKDVSLFSHTSGSNSPFHLACMHCCFNQTDYNLTVVSLAKTAAILPTCHSTHFQHLCYTHFRIYRRQSLVSSDTQWRRYNDEYRCTLEPQCTILHSSMDWDCTCLG